MYKKYIIFIFILAFVFRLFLIPSSYHGDLRNNYSWGETLLKYGTNGFYDRSEWEYSKPNQPALYIYVFAADAYVYQTINKYIYKINDLVSFFPSQLVWYWEIYGKYFVLKVPGILFDLGIGFILFKFFFSVKKPKLAAIVSVVWLFMPVSWYNSAVWGQTDSILNFLGILSVIFLVRKRIFLSIFLFTLCCLYKLSLSIYLPFIVYYLFKNNVDYKILLKGILASVAVFVILFLPFHLSTDFFVWIFDLYKTRLFAGEIGYLTANAFNFWWLINPGKILDSSIFYIFSYSTFGYLIFFGLYIFSLFNFIRNKTESSVFLSLALISFSSFMFLTKMHERYLYPFFPLFIVYLGLEQKIVVRNIMIFVLILLNITYVFNLYHLFWVPSLPGVEKFLQINFEFQYIASFVNLMLLIFVIIFTSVHTLRKKFRYN